MINVGISFGEKGRTQNHKYAKSLLVSLWFCKIIKSPYATSLRSTGTTREIPCSTMVTP